MKIVRVLIFLAIVGTARLAVPADTFASATARVTVNVVPTMNVSAVERVVVRNTRPGPIEATVTFFIRANLHRARIYVEASDLYKDSDPTNQAVAPIPLDLTVPAVIELASAAPLGDGVNRAGWIGQGVPIQSFATHLSESLLFESSQNRTFTQEVDVTLIWDQGAAIRPVGQYGGVVRLTALAVPE